MCSRIKWQFVYSSLRFKKVDLCELSSASMPFGEMLTLKNIQQCSETPEDCLNMAKISHKMCVSKPAISQTLNNLETKGYIVRQIDRADRRRIAIKPTESGQEVLANAEKCYEEAVDALLSQFTEEDIKQLVDLMNRLADAYDEIKHKE